MLKNGTISSIYSSTRRHALRSSPPNSRVCSRTAVAIPSSASSVRLMNGFFVSLKRSSRECERRNARSAIRDPTPRITTASVPDSRCRYDRAANHCRTDTRQFGRRRCSIHVLKGGDGARRNIAKGLRAAHSGIVEINDERATTAARLHSGHTAARARHLGSSQGTSTGCTSFREPARTQTLHDFVGIPEGGRVDLGGGDELRIGLGLSDICRTSNSIRAGGSARGEKDGTADCSGLKKSHCSSPRRNVESIARIQKPPVIEIAGGFCTSQVSVAYTTAAADSCRSPHRYQA